MANNKTAVDLAKDFRAVSVSEFFARNRHLLGYDNPIKALLTVIKEGVDNSADACEEAGILPEIYVETKQLNETRFIITIEDNGPGIVKKHIPNVFASLLYGTKFFRLMQSRGIQGIGISSAVLYSQLTTGKPSKIWSKTDQDKQAYYYELHINTQKNEPEIIKEENVEWPNKKTGVKIELEIEAKYQKGQQSVDQYLKQTAIANPHISLTYINPYGEKIEFPRATKELPKEPKRIKPHPYGIELGILIKMLRDTKHGRLSSFLQNEFCRVSLKVAKEICQKSNLPENSRPSRIAKQEAENLFKSIQETKIMAPPTDCLSPIGKELLEKGLKKEINADFYTSITRSPSVYRGNPFQIEIGLSYGGDIEKEEQIKILRFANRVPLLYQRGACAITRAVGETNWKQYGLQQSGKNIPTGPLVLVVHIASVWVPFTSEAKEAIAHYPEIIKEIKLALQECGRQLGIFIRKHIKAKEQKEKANLFEKYIPELASSLSSLTGDKKEKIQEDLLKILKKGIPELEENGQIEK